MFSSVFEPSDQENIDRKIALGLVSVAQGVKTLLLRAVKRYGLSPIQIHFLSALYFEGENEWTMGAIARRFVLTPATVSDAVGTMEGKGLLRRKRRGADNRIIDVVLTNKGRTLARKVGTWANPLAGMVVSLTRQQKTSLFEAMMFVIKGLEKELLVSPFRMCLTCRYFDRDVRPGHAQPHYCEFLDRSFTQADLRIDCPEYSAFD